MLDDEDDWPVRCPRCGLQTRKGIALLKASTQVRCDGCGATLWYHTDTFLRELDQARRAITDFSRTVRLSKREL